MQPSTEEKSKSLYQLLTSFHHYGLALTFIFTVSNLFILQNRSPGVILLFILPPSCALLLLDSSRASRMSKILAISFLCCIGICIELALIQTLLPKFNFFPQLPRTQSRILSFYVAVYLFYFLVLLPPICFGRSLYLKKVGEQPYLHPNICYLGLFSWGVLMSGFLAGVPFLVKELF
jgi:hypothetical protein